MDSEKNIEDFYRKNWFQLFISTECWTILGYLFLTLFYNETLEIAINEPMKWVFELGLSMLFINKVSFGSLWYMSMILCVYLVLPIFCLYLSRFSLKSLRLPIMIVFLSGFVVPTINKYLAVIESDIYMNFELTYAKIFSYFLVFVFVGYYISKGGIRQKSNSFIYLNFIFWFVLTVVCQLYGYSKPYNLVTEYNSVGILFSSLFLFEIIRRYEMTQCLSKIILFLSKYCFGIYMVHTFVVWTIHRMVPTIWFNRPFTVLGYTAVAFVTSMCIVCILSRFKWCRKYLLLIKN